MNWICISCNMIFDGKGKRDYHYQKEHRVTFISMYHFNENSWE